MFVDDKFACCQGDCPDAGIVAGVSYRNVEGDRVTVQGVHQGLAQGIGVAVGGIRNYWRHVAIWLGAYSRCSGGKWASESRVGRARADSDAIRDLTDVGIGDCERAQGGEVARLRLSLSCESRQQGEGEEKSWDDPKVT